MRSVFPWPAAAFTSLVFLSAGCSISASSASISDSITQSSKSVSDSISSSSPDGSSKSEAAYREDVRDYTVAAARSGRDPVAFQSGLARVAEQHGITNWEADAATFVGIGEGLKQAGIDSRGVAAWSSRMGSATGVRVPVDSLIRQGYDGGRS